LRDAQEKNLGEDSGMRIPPKALVFAVAFATLPLAPGPVGADHLEWFSIVHTVQGEGDVRAHLPISLADEPITIALLPWVCMAERVDGEGRRWLTCELGGARVSARGDCGQPAALVLGAAGFDRGVMVAIRCERVPDAPPPPAQPEFADPELFY
jgi:hypothetical protein